MQSRASDHYTIWIDNKIALLNVIYIINIAFICIWVDLAGKFGNALWTSGGDMTDVVHYSFYLLFFCPAMANTLISHDSIRFVCSIYATKFSLALSLIYLIPGLYIDVQMGYLLSNYSSLLGFILLIGWIIAVSVRYMKIDGLGLAVALVAVMRNVRFSSSQAPSRSPMLGGVSAVCTIALMFLPLDFPNSTIAQGILESFRCLFVLYFLYITRSFLQPDGNAFITADRRDPIIILRSFQDDEKPSVWRMLWSTGLSEKGISDVTLEQRLATYFNCFGPFIAVGNPRDHFDVLGAARVRLLDGEWQKRVLEWIMRARLILAMAGTTPWVHWEFRSVIERGAVDRMVVCFPLSGGSKQQFYVQMFARLFHLQCNFRGTAWYSPLERLTDPSTLRAIAFLDNNQIAVIRSRSKSRNASQLATMIAHYMSVTRSSKR